MKADPLFDLEHTAFFPLTANPVGFHHLLLGECVLRQFPKIEKIVFVLSNGIHPDPTKKQHIPDKQVRLKILKSTIQEFEDPEKSFPAQLGQSHQEFLRFTSKRAEISLLEFKQNFSFRISDHIRMIHQHSQLQNRTQPVKLVIGADLLYRMNNPHIFSTSDLSDFQNFAHFLIAPRAPYDVENEVANIKQHREVELNYTHLNVEDLPMFWLPLMKLSSTQIRRIIQAGHDLGGCLTKTAEDLLNTHNLYLEPYDGELLNEWQTQCWEHTQELEQVALQLKQVLDDRAEQQLPHTLAIVETSTGGRIMSAFSGIPGISRHFLEGMIPYDHSSKVRLLGESIEDVSTVSEEMASALAQAFQKQVKAAFVIAETGMAGPPNPERHSLKNGQCHFALATQQTLYHHFYEANPYLSKREHQLQFAVHALQWLIHLLESGDLSNNSH